MASLSKWSDFSRKGRSCWADAKVLGGVVAFDDEELDLLCASTMSSRRSRRRLDKIPGHWKQAEVCRFGSQAF